MFGKNFFSKNLYTSLFDRRCYYFYGEVLDMNVTKYTNQVFEQNVEITAGSPIFENCVFEKGVRVQGDNKDCFLKGGYPSPVFRSCTFRQSEDYCVVLWHRAQGAFYDCQMVSKNYCVIRIDSAAHGLFYNCSINAFQTCGVAIMIAASGIFEKCCFNFEGDMGSAIYLDACDKEKTRFSKCSFFADGVLTKSCLCVCGHTAISFDECNFFYPKEAEFFGKYWRHDHQFNNCRFNRIFNDDSLNMNNCSFEPDAIKDDFQIGK